MEVPAVCLEKFWVEEDKNHLTLTLSMRRGNNAQSQFFKDSNPNPYRAKFHALSPKGEGWMKCYEPSQCGGFVFALNCPV